MEKTRHVTEYKNKIVADIVKHIKEYPIIGLVNMENLPAPQLQTMKAKLRSKVHLFMTKKRLIKIALEQVKNDKKGIEELEKYFQGMPALLFTKDSPFKLSKTLQRSKSPAPAKAGQTAPKDIIIPRGPTSFAPGPVISELSSVGIKTGVENGKVAVKEDSLIVKKGEKIEPKVAEVLTRLGIEPMEAGLDLVAAYEGGVIYPKEVLQVDEKKFMDKLNNACSGAFNLAMFIEYPTKDTIKALLGKAFNDARAIGLSQNIIDDGIIEELLEKAERSMLSLKDAAHIEVHEKPKEKNAEKGKANEEGNKKEAKPEAKEEKLEAKEEKKPEAKEEPKIEEKKEEPKPKVKAEVKEEAKPEIKPEKQEEKKPEEHPKEKDEEEKPEIESKEPEKEEDIYEEESREEMAAEGEISPAEEGFMEGYEEAGKTEEEEEVKKEKETPESDVDEKVKKMVEETKKFTAGEKGPTADDLLKETEEKEEVKEKKEPEKEKVPSAHELAKKKEKDSQKEVEDLTKKLVKKGTLRK